MDISLKEYVILTRHNNNPDPVEFIINVQNIPISDSEDINLLK